MKEVPEHADEDIGEANTSQNDSSRTEKWSIIELPPINELSPMKHTSEMTGETGTSLIPLSAALLVAPTAATAASTVDFFHELEALPLHAQGLDMDHNTAVESSSNQGVQRLHERDFHMRQQFEADEALAKREYEQLLEQNFRMHQQFIYTEAVPKLNMMDDNVFPRNTILEDLVRDAEEDIEETLRLATVVKEAELMAAEYWSVKANERRTGLWKAERDIADIYSSKEEMEARLIQIQAGIEADIEAQGVQEDARCQMRREYVKKREGMKMSSARRSNVAEAAHVVSSTAFNNLLAKREHARQVLSMSCPAVNSDINVESATLLDAKERQVNHSESKVEYTQTETHVRPRSRSIDR